MQGTIISSRNFVITIASENGLFKADAKNREYLPGQNAEFTAVRQPGLFRAGLAEITDVSDTRFEDSGLLVSKHLKVEGYRVMASPDDPYLAGEGATLQQAFEALADEAKKYDVNALLDFKAEFNVSRFSGACLFKVRARAAVVVRNDEILKAPESRKLSLPQKLARRNSPNGAQKRYIRVLSVCAVFILLPCIARLMQREIITFWQMNTLFALLLAAVILIFIGYFPRRKTGFLLRTANRHAV